MSPDTNPPELAPDGQPSVEAAPLDGVTVVDFTLGVAGPYTSMLLGDLGAEVLRIEKPGGDVFRAVSYAEQFLEDRLDAGGDYSLSINRNKRAMTLNLRDQRGADIARRLAANADIVLEAFRPGVMDRLGLGYETIAEANPGVIYGSLTSFGRAGPLSDKASNDLTMQARAGLMAITGDADGPPVKPGPPVSPLVAGTHMCTALLATLVRRGITGRGQHIHVSILDATMTLLSNFTVAVLDGGADITRMGSAHPSLAPFQAFATRNGSIVIGAANEKVFRSLCDALDLSWLVGDDRFATNTVRVQHQQELADIIEERTASMTSDELIAQLEAHDVACAPVNTLREAFTDTQTRLNGMIVEDAHPTRGSLHLIGIPWQFSESPCSIRRHPPRVGEHTAEVLREQLGMSHEQIAELERDEVV